MSFPHMSPFGNFTIFGFTPEPKTVWQRKLDHHLRIVPYTIDFGQAGHFFFYSSHGDVAESEEVIVLKLGFARTASGSPLSANDLLEQPGVTPRMIAPDAIRGNALIASFSKKEAAFSVYKTMMALPQLYFNVSRQTILCTDNLACLIPFLENPELNEEILAEHFLFKYPFGSATYFKDVYRLFPGELLLWREGDMSVRLARDLHLVDRERQFERVDACTLSRLYESLLTVMGSYLAEIRESGQSFGNLLSGGVDSSVIQHLINQILPLGSSRKSFSYAVRTSDFKFEVEYAAKASQALRTEHTFVDILPEEYPVLLQETIRSLAQPVFTNAEACKLALSKYLALNEPDRRFYFVGQGADSLCGLPMARKLALLDIIRKLPGSALLLRSSAALFQALSGPSCREAHALSQMADMLTGLDDPHSLNCPPFTLLTDPEIEMAARCFGHNALESAFEARHALQARYLKSQNIVEMYQVRVLLTEVYDHAICGYQSFLLNNKKQIYFYLDEDVMRHIFAFAPRVRYLKLGKGLMDRYSVKHLLRKILTTYAPAAAEVTHLQKGFSVFNDDIYRWMKNGCLRPMIQEMERPPFLSQADFQKLLRDPREFTWSLLTMDLFQKEVLRASVYKE